MVTLDKKDLGKVNLPERQQGEMNGFEALEETESRKPKEKVFR